MIHIGLHGDDRVLGMTISLPQVPRKGEHVRVHNELYRVVNVTWYANVKEYVPVVLELELAFQQYHPIS